MVTHELFLVAQVIKDNAKTFKVSLLCFVGHIKSYPVLQQSMSPRWAYLESLIIIVHFVKEFFFVNKNILHTQQITFKGVRRMS